MVSGFLTFSDTQILPMLKILISIFSYILSHSIHCVWSVFIFLTVRAGTSYRQAYWRWRIINSELGENITYILFLFLQ